MVLTIWILQKQFKPKRHLFRARKSAKTLLRLSFILPWMQQTVTFFISVSSARPKYSTHAHVLRGRRQKLIAIFRRFGQLRHMVLISWSISQSLQISAFHTPEEHQVLLVLVLPQKGHQVVEFVLWSTDLTEHDKKYSYFYILVSDWQMTYVTDSRCSSWRVWRVFSGWQRQPHPSLWQWFGPDSWDRLSPVSPIPVSEWLRTSRSVSA